jgi:predicted phosphodiesterase
MFLRRFGLIGDVHGENLALADVLDFLAEQDLNVILCTGDIPAKRGMGSTARSAQLLHDAGVLTIRGNHDRWAIENAEDSRLIGLMDETEFGKETLMFLKSLPSTRRFTTPHGDLLLCHGMGDDDMRGLYPGGDDAELLDMLHRYHPNLVLYRFILHGHTHRRMVRELGGWIFLNAGTLLYGDSPVFSVVDLEKKEVQFYERNPILGTITPCEHFALP